MGLCVLIIRNDEYIVGGEAWLHYISFTLMEDRQKTNMIT